MRKEATNPSLTVRPPIVHSSSDSTPWGFVALMAVLMSFVALAIDAMLPALRFIGNEFSVENPNDVQLVISMIFFGMGFGLMFFGPISDSYGRKVAIYIGMSIFLVGCLISIVSNSFEVMLVGRWLQGLGAASCRVATSAMIRDKFVGNKMAKIMSLIMIIFILVPALAPSFGQAILFFANWRAIFVAMFAIGLGSVLWLAFKQEETLAPSNKRPFSARTIFMGILETLNHKTSRGYTLASALTFGALIGYLSSSQQILQEQYELGNLFSVAFGSIALAIGIAAFTNSRLVEKWGAEYICVRALGGVFFLSSLFLPICYLSDGNPPLSIFMGYMFLTFLSLGMVFGNFNSLAVEPLGHIAGVANSVISSIQTILSVGIGGSIGYAYDGTVLPLAWGFFVLGGLALCIVFNLSRKAALTN